MSEAARQDPDTRRAVIIEASGTTPDGSALSFSWWPDDSAAIRGTLRSGRDGVGLKFGPTVEVQHWPFWLREMTYFAEEGGSAMLWLDPDHAAELGLEDRIAFDIAGVQSRRAVAAFLQLLAAALELRFSNPSIEHQQAIETCTGVALTLVSRRDGVGAAEPADIAWFRPSPAPILIDDMSADRTRQHVRLTYLLPRIAGWWMQACSLRVFHNDHSFGIEFRSLTGDYLPSQIRPVCIADNLGPLIRFTVDRAGRGTTFEGTTADSQAIRIVQAIVRQVSRDMALYPHIRHMSGLDGPAWQHWFAALPDLLAAPAPEPVDTVEH